MKIKIVAIALAGAFITLLSNNFVWAGSDDNSIKTSNAWVKYNPMQGRASAAYMDVENFGDSAVKLVGVSMLMPAHAMMHQTANEGGVMKMMHLESVTIQPKSSITFTPRGMHIMLTNMPAVTKDTSSIFITLVFSTGEKHDVEFKLCPLTALKIC